MKLKDSSLFRQKCLINGRWVAAKKGGTITVTNPATDKKIGTVPDMGSSETKEAIKAAETAFKSWSQTTAKHRASLLRKWHDLLIQHQVDLAKIMTVEQGKPTAEAIGEVQYAAAYVEWFAEEGKRIYGDVIPTHMKDRRILAIKQPVGVCAFITPWNFPMAMITRKCAPALAAGCTVVIKPAAETPYSALAAAELALRAGIPKGVINVVIGDAKAIGGEVCASPVVRKLSFTGSTPVGKLLMKQCADTMKKLSLELGGNAPFIVFDDADLDLAVEGAIQCKFRNCGQTCVCANRIYVQDGIYDEFAKRFAAAVKKFKIGDGLKAGTSHGPLINHAAVEKAQDHVDDAVSKGAKIACGGKPHSLGGNFFQPTVLTGVNQKMKIASEETFGPVAPLIRFKKEDEAIKYANSTPFGLAAYFFSQSHARVWRVSEAIEAGIVGVNTGVISSEAAPFGGVKESGLGREGSKYGIDDYVEIKHISMAGL